MEDDYITVSNLNNQLHKHIVTKFKNLQVKGEISRIHYSKSGHYYFDLKDENSKIQCNLFKNFAAKTIKPEEGVEVIVKGTVNIYKKDGTYSIWVRKIKKAGTGNLHLQYLQLKEKLKNEGLFDSSHKKPIPKVPKRIGVITAKSGAVIHDIITTTKRRWPFTEIFLFPSIVQGEEAPQDLIKQLKRADNFNLDTIIIGRGGGSVEDLWCFNDEKLAREVYNAKTPIISAVGHESDFTIIEEVADKRAATPTAAAEFATPDISEKLNSLESLKKRIKQSLEYKLNENRRDLDRICRNRILNNPQLIYQEKSNNFKNLTYRLKSNSNQIFSKKESEFRDLKNKFKYLSSTLEDSKRNQLKNIESRLEFSSKKLITTKQTELNQIKQTLEYNSNDLIKTNKNQLETIKNNHILKNPQKIIKMKKQALNKTKQTLEYNSNDLIKTNKNQLETIKNNHILKNPQKIIEMKRQELDKNKEKLTLLNPRKTLKRGYTLTKYENKVILSSKTLKQGDEIEIEFDDGSINAKVI